MGFFVVTFALARYVLGLNGFRDLGLRRHQRWSTNLWVGFGIGMLVYGLKYVLFFELNKFQVSGLMPMNYILQTLLLGLSAMLFSSLLNDLMIRGYLFAWFQRSGFLKWYLLAATVIYALDDSWNEGFSWINLAFSVILGISFAYTVLKTGSIWMSFGLHWGGNVMFRIMYGFNGQGVLRLERQLDGVRYDYLSLAVTCLMFPSLYFLLRRWNGRVLTNRSPEPFDAAPATLKG